MPKASKEGEKEAPKDEAPEKESTAAAKDEEPKFGPPIPGSQTSLGGPGVFASREAMRDMVWVGCWRR